MNREYFRDYYQKNKARIREWERAWKQANPEKVKDIMRRSRRKNKAKNDATRAIYQKKNHAAIQKKHREWTRANMERVIAQQIARTRKRWISEPSFRLKLIARTTLTRAIKRGGKKTKGGASYLGCTPNEARKHIESLWLEGMTWDNHSLHGWHIDHIRPLASFDFTDEAQMRCALHYTNLQPLWAKDNLAKHAKYNP